MVLFLRKNRGWAAVLFLVLLPAVRWMAMMPINDRFFNLSVSMTSLGQITGLAGMTLFAVSLILGARLKVLDKYFGGLDKVYQNHHVIGAVSFSMLLFHPLFLVFKFIQFSLRDAALFFLPSLDWARNYGIISLFFMIVLVAMTFYIQMKYQTWKSSHKYMVFVFLFAVLHTYYAVSDVSRDDILRIYVLGLAAIAFVVGFWRAFMHEYYNRNFDYEIIKIINIGSGILEIEMAPKEEKMNFEAGQFIFASFKSKAMSAESHPFTIASAPGEENLKIAVKALGDFTAEMEKIRVGDKVSIEGPYGGFSYKKGASKNQIWVAGGIGITPFLSMAHALKITDHYKIDLYYSVNNPVEAVFLAELSKISLANKDLRIIPWYSKESGRLNGEIISKLSNGVQDKDLYLCGPPIFMISLSEQFENQGISRDRIHWENFNFK